MKKGLLSTIFILCLTGLSHAQSGRNVDDLILQGKEIIAKAEADWNLQQLMAARSFFERLTGDTTYLWLVHYYIAYVDMRLFSYYYGQKEGEKAKAFVDDGIEHLEKAVELKNDFAEGYGLLSSLLGNKIALNPILGMSLGMKSGQMINKALELAPENPRIYLIAGQSAYYTPSMFGGGKDKARRHIEKAMACFHSFVPEKPILPDWGFDEAYVYMGMIQMDEEDFMGAKASFEKALEINPNNAWVKWDLMQKLEEKMGEEKKKD